MTDEWTDQQIAAKIDWEGGVIESIEYGLGSAVLADPTTDFAIAWTKLVKAYETVQPLIDEVEFLAEEIRDNLEDNK